MAVAVKGTPTLVAGTSATIPTHAVGDLIVIVAYRNGSTTLPTKPAASGTVPAWVTILAPTGTNTQAMFSAYFVATATNHTSGTWTNASDMFAVVISGAPATSPIGGSGQSGGSISNQAICPAITLTDASGASLVLQFMASRAVTNWGSPPAGYTDLGTPVTATPGINLSQETTTTTAPAVTRTITSSSGELGQQIEILAAGGTAWTVNPTDSLTTSDAVDHFDYGMSQADGVTPSDSFSDVWTAAVALADTLTSADTNAFGVGKGTFADSLTLSDLATTGLAYNIFPADTLTSSDALDHFDYGMHQADAITPSDAFSRVWTALMSVADSMGTSDAFGDSWAAVVGLVDSLSLSDLATPVLVSNPTAWTITLADVLTLFDAAAAINPLAPRIVRYDPNDYDPNFRPFR